MSFKRRMNQKTDYVQRLGLLKSGKPRLVIRRSLNNVHIQLITTDDGDKTIVETFSRNLRKYGWKGHCGNISAAYLTGYLAGLNAKKHNIKDAVADIGLHTSVRGSRIYAAILGAKDAGIVISIGKEALPKMERINGKHIADYAAKLKPNQEKYKKQFSEYIKKGLNPEELPKHFEEVKKNIENQVK
ncbi:MAG TPA: 50S ribosomal protein L18 [archaeon]|nr:50S ribosomal protein L18 [archaeon]